MSQVYFLLDMEITIKTLRKIEDSTLLGCEIRNF